MPGSIQYSDWTNIEKVHVCLSLAISPDNLSVLMLLIKRFKPI